MAQNRVDDDYNPFAAPVSDLAPEKFQETPSELVYASFWARFVAAIVDGFITQIAGAIIGFVVGLILAGMKDQLGADTPMVVLIVVNILVLVFVWLYNALQESSGAQATLGKRLMGLRVLDLAGEKISFGRATGRYFAKIPSAMLLMIGYLMQPFTQRKQALHDIMAGTIVVKG